MAEVDARFIETIEKVASLTDTVINELSDRLEDAPESFDVKELTTLMRDGLDRTGHGPSSTVTTVQDNLGDRLEAARMRAKQARLVSPDIIEAELITPAPEEKIKKE